PAGRLSGRRGLGLLLGFCGVFVVLGAWDGLAGHDLAGALLALGGGLCYGIGFPYTRRFLTGTGNSSLSLAAGQLLCGSAMLAVLTPALTGAPAALPLLPVLSVTALGALGTGVAYILNYGIITKAGATIAATVAYLMPLVSVVAGVAVLGERLAWNQPAGAAVIIAGAALAQTRARVNPSVRTARRWPRRPGTPAAAPAAVPGRSGHGCARSHPAPTSARRRRPQPLPRSGRRRRSPAPPRPPGPGRPPPAGAAACPACARSSRAARTAGLSRRGRGSSRSPPGSRARPRPGRTRRDRSRPRAAPTSRPARSPAS